MKKATNFQIPFLLLLFFTSLLSAQITWTGNVSSNWANSDNWDPKQVPTANDLVTIPNVANDPVIPAGTGAVARSVHVQTGALLTINASGKLTISSAGLYTSPLFTTAGLNNEGTVNNNGELFLTYSSSTTIFNGILNAGTFNNNSPGGNIHIAGLYQYGLYNYSGVFNNLADMTIDGGGAGDLGLGIDNLAAFYNYGPQGNIRIDNTKIVGLRAKNASTFNNAAALTIGSNASVGYNAIWIYEAANFNNQSGGGKVWIGQNSGNMSGDGIYVEDAGSKLTNGGRIWIDNTGLSGIFTREAAMIHNQAGGELLIGQNGGNIGRDGIYVEDAGSKLSNQGLIRIGHTNRHGIFNDDGATSHNQAGGQLLIGQNGGNIGGDGFQLTGAGSKLTNEGEIRIDHTGFSGLVGLNSAEISNLVNGHVAIGQSGAGSIAASGCYAISSASYTNAGLIEVDNSFTNGVYHGFGATFHNQPGGELLIGQNDGNIEGDGFYLIGVGSKLTNESLIRIDHTVASGLVVLNSAEISNLVNGHLAIGQSGAGSIAASGCYASGSTTFTNAGLIEVDNTTAFGLYHVQSSSLHNQAGGQTLIGQNGTIAWVGLFVIASQATNEGVLKIDNAGVYNLENKDNAVFDNKNGGQVFIGMLGGMTLSGIKNGTAGNINNLDCSVIRLFDNLNNEAFVLNEGLFHVNTAKTSTAGDFINNGIVEDIQGTLSPLGTNNALLVAPITGECAIMPALMVGGTNGFTPSTNWYTDPAMNDVGGTYDLANDRFTVTYLAEGSHTLYFTASGNGCSFDLSIQVDYDDVTGPMPACFNPTVVLDANGQYTLQESDVFDPANSTDNCGTVSFISADPAVVNCTQVWGGPVHVTVTASDGNGNTGTCTALVTVEDNEAPVPTCKTGTVQLDATGNYTLTENDVFAGGTDNCNIVNYWQISPTAVSCADVGTPVSVLVEVFDASGNQASCTATITVEDSVAPAANCKNHTVQLDANGNASLTASDLNGGSTDACGIASFSASPNSFVCGNIGPNTVTLIVTDIHGNPGTCTATVTVEDNIAPVITCANATVQLDANGEVTITPATTFTGSSDNCGFVGLEPLSQTQFTCADVGPNPVTLNGFDGNGNTTSCTATVTVEDNISPSANCTTTTISATLDADGNYTIDPNEINDGSSDVCGGLILSVAPSTLTCQHEGPNTVTLTVTDANGNTSTCAATVEVAPFITISSIVATDESCAGSGDGAITITATAGGGQLGYSIDGGVSFQYTGIFNNVTPGTYNLQLKVFGIPNICEKTATATVGAGPQPTIWYKDLDGDGYTDYVTQTSCAAPTGYKALGNLAGTEEDCDDNKSTWFPGQVWYPDYDVDFYGALPAVVQCSRPAGHRRADNLIEVDTDCDNNNSAIHPGAVEICNGIDDNCDGEVDEGLSGLTYVGNVSFTTQAQLDAWLVCYEIIQGHVTIQGANITDLTPLSNIVEITGNLTILTNGSLTTLNGLESLATVGNSLMMYYNFQLSDCCAIDGLLTNGGVGGSVTIFYNAIGSHCNSAAEIMAACPVTPLAGSNTGNSLLQSCQDCLPVDLLRVFPNPASTTVTVRWSGENPSGTVQLTDLMGRVLTEQDLQSENRFHVFRLQSGNYAVRVKAEGYKQQVVRVVVDR